MAVGKTRACDEDIPGEKSAARELAGRDIHQQSQRVGAGVGP